MGEIHEEVVQRAEARVGSWLCGKFHLDRLLGVGGMAAVFSATHRNGNRVAVKMLHTALSMEADLRRRFLREGYVANAVDHPGAVRVLDDDVAEDGSIFLVMDLIAGVSIETVAEFLGGRLPANVVLSITHQLLDIVAAAHANGVVHRDIKPDNVCLTRDGNVMLLDFGVARMLEGGNTATRDGTTIGTPAFMSPEQALGKVKDIDALSDVYAVGAVVFTLLSGRWVHEGESPNELLILAATKPARSLADVAADTPAVIVDFVKRALAFEKADRWQSAREMQKALAETYQTAFGAPMLEGVALASILHGVADFEFTDWIPPRDESAPTALPSASWDEEKTVALPPPPSPAPSVPPPSSPAPGISPPPAVAAAPAVPAAPPVADDHLTTGKWSRETPGPQLLSGIGTSPFVSSSRMAEPGRARRAALAAVLAGVAVLGLAVVVLLVGRNAHDHAAEPVEPALSTELGVAPSGSATDLTADADAGPEADTHALGAPAASSAGAPAGASASAAPVDVYSLPRVKLPLVPLSASAGGGATDGGHNAGVATGRDAGYDPFAHQ